MNGISWYILAHAGLGDLGSLCFLWITAEIINGSQVLRFSLDFTSVKLLVVFILFP